MAKVAALVNQDAVGARRTEIRRGDGTKLVQVTVGSEMLEEEYDSKGCIQLVRVKLENSVGDEASTTSTSKAADVNQSITSKPEEATEATETSASGAYDITESSAPDDEEMGVLGGGDPSGVVAAEVVAVVANNTSIVSEVSEPSVTIPKTTKGDDVSSSMSTGDAGGVQRIVPDEADVCFGASEHPGTIEWAKIIRSLAEEYPDDAFSSKVIKEVKRQMPASYFLMETEDANGVMFWREASKRERNKYFKKLFEKEQKNLDYDD